MTDRPRILLHLGFHKTATSTVQHVYKALPQSHGIAYMQPVDKRFAPLREAVMRLRDGQGSVAAARAGLEAVMASVAGFREVRISEENLISLPPFSLPIYSTGSIYERMEPQIALLDDLFADYDLTYAVTWRDTVDFIYSLYCDGLWLGRYNMTFAQYVKRINVASFTPQSLVGRVRAATTRPVMAIGMKRLSTDPRGFLGELIAPADLEEVPDRLIMAINRRPSLAALAIMRTVSPHPPAKNPDVRAWIASCPVPLDTDKGPYNFVALREDVRQAIEAEIASLAPLPA